MPLNPSQLATAIQSALQGPISPITSQIQGLASDICTHLASGVLNNAPGTIVGIVNPIGGPLAAGAGTNGLITLVAAALVSAIGASVGGSTPEISGIGMAISNSLATSNVVFAPGGITGVTTNVGPPTPAPGILTLGAGTNGMITALVDSALASAIASGVGGTVTPKISALASAIVTHVMTNAVATYAPGTVVGVAPSGGGTLAAGAGAGGTIA